MTDTNGDRRQMNYREYMGDPTDTGATEGLNKHVAAARYAEAAAVIRRDWYELLQAGPGPETALERVPIDVLRTYPTMAVLLGLKLYVVPHLRSRSADYFSLVTSAVQEGAVEIDPVDRVLALGASAVASRLLGRPDAGVAAASQAFQLLTQLPPDARARVGTLPRVYSQLGTTLFYGGRTDEAVKTFERGLAESPPEGHPDGFSNLAMLAGIRALDGDIDGVGAFIDLARSPGFVDADRAGYSGTFYRIALATVAIERFDPADACAHLAAMRHDRRTIEHWIPIAVTEARIGLLSGRAAEAKAELDAFARSRGSEGTRTETRRALAPIRALLELALGDPYSADALLARSGGDDPAALIGRARAALALSNPSAALAFVHALTGKPLSPRLAAELNTVRLAALLTAGSPRTAGAISDLSALVNRTRQRFALTMIPDPDYQSVRDALSRAGHDRLVQSLPARAIIPAPDGSVRLTERERVVLQQLTRTGSAVVIAHQLQVSVNTVKTQLRGLYRKLGASNRDAALTMARERHLLGTDDAAARDRAVIQRGSHDTSEE